MTRAARIELVNELAFYKAKVQHESLKIAAIQVMLDTGDGGDEDIGEEYRTSLELELGRTKREYAKGLAKRNIAARMLDL